MPEVVGATIDIPRPHLNNPQPKVDLVQDRFLGKPLLRTPFNSLRSDQQAIDEGRDTLTQFTYRLATDSRFLTRLKSIPREQAIDMAYRCILNRDPDPDGKKHYLDQFQFEQINDLLTSNEGTTKHISDLYREMLGRDPDPEGLKIYLEKARVKPGYWGIFETAKELRQSDEYFYLTLAKKREYWLKGHEKEEGDWVQRALNSVEGKIQKMYFDFYHTQPDLRQLDMIYKICEQVTTEKLTLPEVRQRFATDGEYIKRLRGRLHQSPHTTNEVMQDMYWALLNRPADAEGLRIYTEQLQKGRDVEQIINELLHCREYGETAVRGLYKEILLRDPDEVGLNIYSEQIRTGKANPVKVAAELRRSDEGKEAKFSYIDDQGRKLTFKEQ